MEGNPPNREERAEPKHHVLIVDDEASARTLLRTTVNSLPVPCRVAEAADGETALQLARESRPDLVLLDIVLPGSSVSGVMVCQELCKDLETRVVLITGRASDAITRTCMALGAVECVRKPFSVEEMRDTLVRWLPA
jgi:CheY-like chemotaxis protein